MGFTYQLSGSDSLMTRVQETQIILEVLMNCDDTVYDYVKATYNFMNDPGNLANAALCTSLHHLDMPMHHMGPLNEPQHLRHFAALLGGFTELTEVRSQCINAQRNLWCTTSPCAYCETTLMIVPLVTYTINHVPELYVVRNVSRTENSNHKFSYN